MDEFAVGKLLDVGDANFNNGTEIATDRRPEVSAETFVEHLQRPHLVFADAFRAFEVVSENVGRITLGGMERFARVGCHRSAAGRNRRGRAGTATIYGREQGIDFGLFQHITHAATSMSAGTSEHYRPSGLDCYSRNSCLYARPDKFLVGRGLSIRKVNLKSDRCAQIV